MSVTDLLKGTRPRFAKPLALGWRRRSDPVRELIRVGIAELDEPIESVSVSIGMAPDFLRDYLDRNNPTVLPPNVRRKLAEHIGVPEHALR